MSAGSETPSGVSSQNIIPFAYFASSEPNNSFANDMLNADDGVTATAPLPFSKTRLAFPPATETSEESFRALTICSSASAESFLPGA